MPKYRRVALLVPMYSVPGYDENNPSAGVGPLGLASVVLPVSDQLEFVAAANAAKLIWPMAPVLVAMRIRSLLPIADPAVPDKLLTVSPSSVQPPEVSMKPRLTPFVPNINRVKFVVPIHSVPPYPENAVLIGVQPDGLWSVTFPVSDQLEFVAAAKAA